MSTKQTIRFNSILNQWEHWVMDSSYQEGGYWSVGFIGNNSIHSPILELTYDANSSVVNSMEDAKYQDYVVQLYKSVPDSNHYELFNDMKFSELIDTNDLHPIINSINVLDLFKTNDIQILIDTEVEFIIYATNILTDDSTGLVYIWKIGNENFTTLATFINVLISKNNEGESNCVVRNQYGDTTSESFNITVHDPIRIPEFNVNLIKNDLNSWNVDKGIPEEMDFWVADTNSNVRAALFNTNGIDFSLYSEINEKYIIGGIASINNLVPTIITQEIDLSTFSEYINKSIYGVSNVNLILYGYLGTWGDNKGYIGEVTPYGINGLQLHGIYRDKINYRLPALNMNSFYSGIHIDTTEGFSAINKDYVLVDFTLLNSTNIALSSIQFKSIQHDSEMKFYLNSTYMPIPVGATKLKITCKFIKSNETLQYYNYRWWEDYGISPVYSGITNLDTAYKHDHLSSIYGLTARLDINEKYILDIKQKLNITNGSKNI